MPSRNTVRNFYTGGHYHVYNRGVEKRTIFEEKRDYLTFIYYLSVFLSPLDQIDTSHPFYEPGRRNFSDSVSLFAYCLMPNHFHLFLRQDDEEGISSFMKALSNAYTRYFNYKNDRVGHLFQGKYKAAHITTESYYLHLSRYIHQNPLGINMDPFEYSYSSLANYVNETAPAPVWLKSAEILTAFSSPAHYRDFLSADGNSSDMLGALTID